MSSPALPDPETATKKKKRQAKSPFRSTARGRQEDGAPGAVHKHTPTPRRVPPASPSPRRRAAQGGSGAAQQPCTLPGPGIPIPAPPARPGPPPSWEVCAPPAPARRPPPDPPRRCAYGGGPGSRCGAHRHIGLRLPQERGQPRRGSAGLGGAAFGAGRAGKRSGGCSQPGA